MDFPPAENEAFLYRCILRAFSAAVERALFIALQRG